MPLLAKRLAGKDRRRNELGAPSGIDRRRCAERRTTKTGSMPMSDTEWHEYLEMPNFLEISVEVPHGLQIKAEDTGSLTPSKS